MIETNFSIIWITPNEYSKLAPKFSIGRGCDENKSLKDKSYAKTRCEIDHKFPVPESWCDFTWRSVVPKIKFISDLEIHYVESSILQKHKCLVSYYKEPKCI